MANKELRGVSGRIQLVDEELVSTKVGRKAFMCTAYAMGVALGFSIMVLFLPDPQGVEKAERMIQIFHAFSLSLLVYSAIAIYAMVFVRAMLKYVMIMLNWFAFPTVAYAFVNDLYNMMVAK